MPYFQEMTYNNNSSSTELLYILFRVIMKICKTCSSSFKPFGPEKACSIKCKLLDGIIKTENDCWLFKKQTSGQYSKIRWQKKWWSAHRCSYEIFKNTIPADKWVCHRCDTPKCINPDHLFLGSPKDNARDARNKKRSLFGQKHHFARFSDTQIEEIRLLHEEGKSFTRLTRIFNCSVSYLSRIINKKLRLG